MFAGSRLLLPVLTNFVTAHYLGVCHIYHLRYNCNCCFNDVWADIKHVSITFQIAQIEITNWKYD